jgi:spore coat protein U-like protein
MPSTTTYPRRAALLLGALSLLAASATASAQSCAFRGGAPAGITFASLDPSNATVVTASTNVDIRCTGAGVPPPSSWGFSGLYGANPNLRLKHATLTDYIAYSVGNPPLLVSSSGPNNQTYRVTATILPASYLNAYAGTYSDSLTITVSP